MNILKKLFKFLKDKIIDHFTEIDNIWCMFTQLLIYSVIIIIVLFTTILYFKIFKPKKKNKKNKQPPDDIYPLY